MSIDTPESFDDESGTSSAPLFWQRPYDAAQKFLAAASAVHQELEGFELARSICRWLEEDVLPTVVEYIEQLEKCEDDFDLAVELNKELILEHDSIVELLEFLDEIDDEIDDAIGEEASKRIKDDLVNFLNSRLEPLKVAGWHMCNVFIGAD